MAGLGSLVVDLSADTAKFQSDMGRAAQVAERDMGRVRTIMAGASTAIVASAAAAGAGLLAMAKSALDAGDAIAKATQKIGISAESFQELKFGAELADVSFEALTVGLKKFNVALVDASNPTSEMARVMKVLGVDVRAGPEPALRQFADAVSKLEDGELKTALATKVLGKAGQDLIPFLNAGSKGMDDAAASARKLGLIMSEETVKAAEQFNDNLKKITTTSAAMGAALLAEASQGMVSFTNELVKAKEEGNSFLGTMKEIGKALLALGSKLPGSLGELSGMAADAAFQGGNGALGGAKSGRIRRPGDIASDDAIFAEFLGPDQDALRKALNGTKSLKDDAAKKELERLKQLGLQILRTEQGLEAERAEFRNFMTDEHIRQAEEAAAELVRIEEAMFRDIEAQEDAYYERGRQNLEIHKAQMKVMAEEQKRIDDIVRDLSHSFSSAFEEALAGGKSFSDILKGLENDLLRLGTRLLVTEPLMREFAKMVKGGGGENSDIMRAFGGSSTEGGFGDLISGAGKWLSDLIPSFDTGTPYVQRDMLAMVHKGEAIIPAGQNTGGSTVIMNINTPDVGSFRASRNQIAGEMQAALSASRRNR